MRWTHLLEIGATTSFSIWLIDGPNVAKIPNLPSWTRPVLLTNNHIKQFVLLRVLSSITWEWVGVVTISSGNEAKELLHIVLIWGFLLVYIHVMMAVTFVYRQAVYIVAVAGIVYQTMIKRLEEFSRRSRSFDAECRLLDEAPRITSNPR